MMVRVYIIFTLFVCLATIANSQTLVDKDVASLFEFRDAIKPDYKRPLRETDKEVNVIISSGFLVYKSFVSSQDKPSCIFTPSCSEYSVDSFRKKGFFLGWMSTFDRLSRCHGLVKPTDYVFDKVKMRFYDPVE